MPCLPHLGQNAAPAVGEIRVDRLPRRPGLVRAVAVAAVEAVPAGPSWQAHMLGTAGTPA
jgi:hypothetical protein